VQRVRDRWRRTRTGLVVPVPTGRWWSPVEPTGVPGGTVREVDPADLVGLRRAVLRDGRADLPASYPWDSEPSTLHLGMVTPGEQVVGCVTVRVDPWPGFASLHLVLMAVDASWRRRGVGRALVGTVQESATAAGLDVWAAARTGALDFYRELGFTPAGDVFVAAMDLPHRRVLWRHS